MKERRRRSRAFELKQKVNIHVITYLSYWTKEPIKNLFITASRYSLNDNEKYQQADNIMESYPDPAARHTSSPRTIAR